MDDLLVQRFLWFISQNSIHREKWKVRLRWNKQKEGIFLCVTKVVGAFSNQNRTCLTCWILNVKPVISDITIPSSLRALRDSVGYYYGPGRAGPMTELIFCARQQKLEKRILRYNRTYPLHILPLSLRLPRFQKRNKPLSSLPLLK